MRVRFVGQPFKAWPQVGGVVRELLLDPGVTSFWGAVAWAKRSGLSRIAGPLADFRQRGGHSSIVVGIDEGGATREGLELALELFDEVYVFHDRGARTFHPKAYVLEGSDRAHVLVGSPNATKGGLFTNYEASTVIDLDLSAPDDRVVRDDVRAYFDELLRSGDAVHLLTADLIDTLASDPQYRVVSEGERNAARAARKTEGAAPTSIFGAPLPGLGSAPAADVASPMDEADDAALEPPLPAGSAPTGAGLGEGTTTHGGASTSPPVSRRGFWKQLSNWDAAEASAPGQIQIPIGFMDFFSPMSEQTDATHTPGVRQFHAEFPVVFRDGPFMKDADGRAILYEPAPTHPRPNKELRFTFRDAEVRHRLNAGDVSSGPGVMEGR